ncbi:MAG: glycosyltransferase family 4 protein [Ruminococcus flavefaciens]|nr:glycosyltransferase family 4 protein [Ruminococcus flavefaciens]
MKGRIIALLTNNDDDVFCFRLELIQVLKKLGYKILISCPDGPKFEVMEREYDLKKNVDYIYDNPKIDRRGTNIINDCKLISHYRKLFIKYRPNVVLTYTAKPNVYATLIAYTLNIPVINNVTGFGSVLNEKKLKRKFIMNLFKCAYRKSSCIMFQNATNLQIAKKTKMINSDYKLIPGSGVALERYPIQNYPEGGDGTTGAVIVFNYIGRILHDKGVDDYIEAAQRIRKKYPKTEFNLIGFIEPSENHYKQKLKSLGEAKVVFYRGSQDDVKPWIQRSHCLIHPSIYGEGMSNVLLENAASGRPLITTNNAGCQETVDNKNTGFIYTKGDVSELVKTIEEFLKLSNEERRIMGLKGRSKVEKEFDRKIVIDEYTSEIKSLITSNNGGHQ